MHGPAYPCHTPRAQLTKSNEDAWQGQIPQTLRASTRCLLDSLELQPSCLETIHFSKLPPINLYQRPMIIMFTTLLHIVIDSLLSGYSGLPVVLGVAWLSWYMWRFKIRPALQPTHPQEMPYWIPGLLTSYRSWNCRLANTREVIGTSHREVQMMTNSLPRL